MLGQPGVKRQTPVTSAKGTDRALTLAAPPQVTLAPPPGASSSPQHPRMWGAAGSALSRVHGAGEGGQASFLPPPPSAAALCLHLPIQQICVKSAQECAGVLGPSHNYMESLCPPACLVGDGSVGLQPPPGDGTPLSQPVKDAPSWPRRGLCRVAWGSVFLKHRHPPTHTHLYLSKTYCSWDPVPGGINSRGGDGKSLGRDKI